MDQRLLLSTGDTASSQVNWRALLYVLHAACKWGERMWEFSAGLLLLDMSGGTSLRLTATLNFAMMLVSFLFGSSVGKLIDTAGELRGPMMALGLQSVGIALSAVCASFALRGGGSQFAVGVIVLACVARLACMGSTLSVEKRWARALSNNDPSTLSTLSARMRFIDLSCKILAPSAAGIIMTLVSPGDAAVMIAAFNVLAWPIEAACLRKVYSDSWCCHQLELRSAASPAHSQDTGKAPAEEGSPWRLYFAQTTWHSSLALSLLHLTVLSMGSVMTAYLMTLGVSAMVVAICRGVGELFGLAATRMAPILRERHGAAHAATIFIWMQWTCLASAVLGASNWARSWPPLIPVALMVCGVGSARFGLWGFDLSVNQLMQEHVPATVQGRVSGVQQSLENFFGAGASVSAVILADPSQFCILAYGSWCAVTVAALLHTLTQGHLQ